MSDENQGNNRKFKNYFINPEFQFRYIFWTTGMGFFVILINGFVFYKFMNENYFLLIELSPMTDEVKAQLVKEMQNIIYAIVAFSFLFIGLTASLGLVLSHKVAGPLHKMKKIFSQISEGQTDLRIKLRPNDEFQDLADSCNTMLDKILGKK